MSVKRFTRVLASAGVTAGLAFGGLATVGAPAATAATGGSTQNVDASYLCNSPQLAAVPVLGPVLSSLTTFEIPATFTLSNLPDVLTDNLPIPAGTPIIGSLNLSGGGGLAGLLAGVGLSVQQATVSTPLAPVGATLATVLGTVSNGVATFETTINGATAGLPIPTSLDASILTNNPLLGLLGIQCQLKTATVNTTSPGAGNTTTTTTTVRNFSVAKAGSAIKARVQKKAIKRGQKGVVKVTVSTSTGAKGVGMLVVKAKGQKAKTVALKNGKAKLTFKKLKVGANKIKLKYAGNAFTDGSKKNVRIKVRNAVRR
jgi:hypothetical protein